ncbi:MAG TPA: 3-dehydroquinate synthase [Clostridia bacterium]
MLNKVETLEELIPIKLKSGLGYEIIIGRELDEMIINEMSGDAFLVVDQRVYELYNSKLNFERMGNRLYILKSGEYSKSWKYVEQIGKKMLKTGCNRHTKMIAIGGGVTGDLCGFVASIFMRGIKIVHIPTTLLSCIDSSIGGKTGINLDQYKNMLGSFYQPSKIIISTNFFATLPFREIKCGIGEIIKTSLLSKTIFDYVNSSISKLMVLDAQTVLNTIKLCVEFKDHITSSDEKEASLRKILNLGHTVGHALESMDKFKLSHGEYVLCGIEMESKMARELGIIDEDYYKIIMHLLNSVTTPKVKIKNIDKLIHIMKADKKNTEGKIDFIFAKGQGETQEYLISSEELKTLLEAVI